MANTFNTIHIFGFGSTQFIAKEKNYSVKSSELTTLQPIIDDVTSKRPQDKVVSEIHAINIFDGIKVSFLGKEKNSTFSLKFNEIDSVKLTALVNELISKEPTPVVNP
jgi:hypothetical protein